jgi:hypothetical protein
VARGCGERVTGIPVHHEQTFGERERRVSVYEEEPGFRIGPRVVTVRGGVGRPYTPKTAPPPLLPPLLLLSSAGGSGFLAPAPNDAAGSQPAAPPPPADGSARPPHNVNGTAVTVVKRYFVGATVKKISRIDTVIFRINTFIFHIDAVIFRESAISIQSYSRSTRLSS